MLTLEPDARRARIHARGASASGGSRAGEAPIDGQLACYYPCAPAWTAGRPPGRQAGRLPAVRRAARSRRGRSCTLRQAQGAAWATRPWPPLVSCLQEATYQHLQVER